MDQSHKRATSTELVAKYVDATDFHAERVPANGKRALVTGITGKILNNHPLSKIFFKKKKYFFLLLLC